MTKILRLESISLCDIGVFKSLEINFERIPSQAVDDKKAEIHLFTGANGSGKSTILYAIAEIFNAYNYQSNTLITTRYTSEKSRVDFKFSDAAGSYGVAKPIVDDENKIATKYGKAALRLYDQRIGKYFAIEPNENGDKLFWYKSSTANYQVSEKLSQTKFEFSAFAYSGTRTMNNEPLNSGIQEITVSPFEQGLSFNNTVRPQILNQWIANNRTQAALARQDNDIAAAEEYDQLLKNISNLIRDICDIEIQFSLKRSPLEVRLKVNNKNIAFDGLPDGLKSIISWIADLILRLENIPWKNGINIFEKTVFLMLDEIDIHLHPKWQRKILPAVQKLLPNAQIFVSTHSPFVIGSIEDATVYKLPDPRDSEISTTIIGTSSAAGKSYGLILNEIFGVDEEFDIETETLFRSFYEKRNVFKQLKNNRDDLLECARKLAKRGEEIEQIISLELRQLSRISGEDLSLV